MYLGTYLPRYLGTRPPVGKPGPHWHSSQRDLFNHPPASFVDHESVP